jgi:hypothetical protein
MKIEEVLEKYNISICEFPRSTWRIEMNSLIDKCCSHRGEYVLLVQLNQNTIEYINAASEEAQLTMIKQNIFMFQFIINPSEKLQLEAEKLQLEAVERDGSFIQFINKSTVF